MWRLEADAVLVGLDAQVDDLGQVEDIAAALARLRGLGVRLIDETPRVGIRGSRVAFLDLSASGAVLTELVEPAANLHA